MRADAGRPEGGWQQAVKGREGRRGESTLQAKIADLLARQSTQAGDETAQTTPLQTLVSGLMPAAKGDALKTLTTANSADNSKTELSEEELAGLSALMAMLPHQQTSTPVTAKGAGSEGLKATSAGRHDAYAKRHVCTRTGQRPDG